MKKKKGGIMFKNAYGLGCPGQNFRTRHGMGKRKQGAESVSTPFAKEIPPSQEGLVISTVRH